MAAKPNKLKAKIAAPTGKSTLKTKESPAVKKAALKKSAPKKSPAKKAAKKVVSKTVAKKGAPKTAPKKAPKKAAKKAAAKKTVAKKVVVKKPVQKKAVVKTSVPAQAGKAVVKKAAIKKAAAKKPVVKKAAAKKPVAKKVLVAKPPVKKPVLVAKAPAAPVAAPTPVIAPVAKIVPTPALRPVAPPISLKGLRGISGAKAARIAQIVAESFLPKVTEPVVEVAPIPVAVSHVAGTDTLVPSAQASSEALVAAHKAAAVLFSKKAEDVVLMDLRNLSTVADYYLIATCTNEPQMRSIIGTVQRALSREGIKSLRSEYMTGARWAVIDYGDLIVHLFEKQTRGYYSLERLWADAPATTLKAEDYALPEDTEVDADEDGDL